jgi:hypothetical protein
MSKELKPTDPNYPRWVQLNTELTTMRRAMRLLKKERESLLAGGAAPTRRPTPMLGVPVGPLPVATAAFSQAPAGAPRAAPAPAPAPTSSALHGNLAAHVKDTFEKNPGVVYTSATMAIAVGVGAELQRPVANAIKGLLREKLVTEVGRNKYTHLKLVEAPAATATE